MKVVSKLMKVGIVSYLVEKYRKFYTVRSLRPNVISDTIAFCLLLDLCG